MKDGLALFYIKDDTLYPVAMTKEQVDVFEMLQGLIPGKLRVCSDKPQGSAINLIDK
ncbi:MAG TPA: hypothetical protein VIM42_11460 [Clostridium sp.]